MADLIVTFVVLGCNLLVTFVRDLFVVFCWDLSDFGNSGRSGKFNEAIALSIVWVEGTFSIA